MYKSIKKKKNVCASLEAQWWIICLPMQQTRVRSPVQEDPTCHKATETVNHKYWACALGPGSHKTAAPTSCISSSVFAPQEKPPHWEAVCIRNTVAPSSLQPERSPPSNKDPAKPRINKSTFKRLAKSIKCWKKNDVSEHVFVCVCVCVERERGESLCCTAEITTIDYQFSSVTQSCPTLCDLKDCSTPSFPVHHQLPEFTQTLDHGVSDAIQPSRPLSSPSPPTFNLSQHQGLFKWVSSSHWDARVLDF